MLKLFYLKLSDPDFSGDVPGWLRSCIGEETYAGVMKFRSLKVRKTKLLGEWLLRGLLFHYYGFEENDVDIVRNEHGKPYLSGIGQRVFFNISHSGDYLLCALSDEEVGVDIERKGAAKTEVAERFFNPVEITEIQRLDGAEQDDLFFRYWSAKESFLKYTGKGLTRPLSSFIVSFTASGIKVSEGGGYLPVCLTECRIDSGYKCFLCGGQQEEPEILRVSGRFDEKMAQSDKSIRH